MGTNSYFSLRQIIPVLLYLHMYTASIVFVNTGMVDGKRIRSEPSKIRKFVIGLMEKVEPNPNTQSEPYGVNSPFTLPPFDALPPVPLLDTSPPYCIYPSSPPPSPFYYPGAPPATTIPGPPGSFPSPNPNPNPPATVTPSPPTPVPYYGPPAPGIVSPPPVVIVNPSPPYEPSPPYYEPSPGGGAGGGGGGFNPPVIFEPPVVFPPPMVPPPTPNAGPSVTLWCVVKPSVPDPIIQEAMNYACGSGADCASIQPNGACFEPDTLFAHASYAFNSYWQRTKVAGGTCSFGGTAMLVTVDPSYDGCHFVNL